MLGLAVAMVLASYGSEGPREEKFRGALIAQASAPTTIDRAAVQRELDNLLLERPDFTGAAIAMSIGGGFTLIGVVAFSIMAAAGVTSAPGIILLVMGMICVPGGLIIGLVAGLVMIGVAMDRHLFDERMRVLRGKLEQAPEPPLPPSSVMAPSPALLLARF